MKKRLLFLLLPFTGSLHAQNALTITPGTDIYISPSNILNLAGLSLTPSSAFNISEVSVTKNAAPANSGLATTVSRTYLFNATSAPFSGTIRFYYSDAELNSLNESSLLLQTHNGTAWKTAGATSRDAVNNYVEVTGVSNLALSEVALNVTTILPLTWKQVIVQRQQNSVLIQWFTGQEVNVSHFSVEKSTGNEGWQTIANNIKATNTAFDQQYSYTDTSHIKSRALYRIRQVDVDGHFTYSKVVTLSAVDGSATTSLYPNPVRSQFSVQLSHPGNVKEILLYHASGMLVEKWQTAQASYSIERLPAGVYQLCILEKNGKKQYLPLIKN